MTSGKSTRGSRASGRIETRLTEPGAWWQVDRVVTRGTRLYYELTSTRSVRDSDGGFRRDDRGRIALEAFAGLPIDRMYARLTEAADGEPFEELTALGEVFGPLGLEWPRALVVENPEADRLTRQNDGLRMASRGLLGSSNPSDAPERSEASVAGTDAWRVMLPKPGTLASGRVERAVSHPGLPWEDAVRAGDDLLPHDELGSLDGGPLIWAHERLTGALELADALARTDDDAIKRCLESRVLGLPEQWHWDQPPGPARASRKAGDGPRRGDADWLELGRRAFAAHVSFELFHSGVGVDARGDSLSLAPRFGSLMELIYLQLVDHVNRHPDFGIGRCGYCEMPILRIRRAQRFHRGCGPAARQRASRARRRPAPEAS